MKTKGGGPHNFRGGAARKARRDASLEAMRDRLEAWRELSPAKQIAALDRRLGKDIGARKQRARLAAIARRP